MCINEANDTQNFTSLPTMGRGRAHLPPTPPPHLFRSLAFGPSLTNPGYNTVSGLISYAWGHNTHAPNNYLE